MTQNAKIGQHSVWVMVVRCGEKSPHKPLGRGRAHDAQGLLLRRVGKECGDEANHLRLVSTFVPSKR